jgi:hypothetical protein
LRKAIKIKASVLLLAWSVIFAHSVIPHNHIDENFLGCMGPLHYLFSFSPCEDTSLRFDNAHSDIKTCSLLNSFFHTFNPEIFLAYTYRDAGFTPSCPGRSLITDNNYSCFSDHLKGTDFLRAPPAL